MDQIAMLSGLRAKRRPKIPLYNRLGAAPKSIGLTAGELALLSDEELLAGLHEIAREARRRNLMEAKPLMHLLIGAAAGFATAWYLRK